MWLYSVKKMSFTILFQLEMSQVMSILTKSFAYFSKRGIDVILIKA